MATKKKIDTNVKAEEGIDLNNRLNDFIQKNRKILLAGLIALVVALIGVVAGVSIFDAVSKKALTTVDELNRRYEVLRFDITEPEKEADVTALLADLTVFASKHSGYAGARASSIVANIHADRKNWTEAQTAWLAAAKSGAKTYLVPVALYNAAIAAEEQGDVAGAIDLYTQSLSYSDLFPAASRAGFALGRLQEAQSNTEAATKAYQDVLDKWPNDQVWASLAQSRLIALSK
jgi:tetratricopeptide (TPR) repeat protein